MTDIAFHFGTHDKMDYVCRLLRKASSTGAKVVVLAQDAMVDTLDEELWNMSATDFVPHCTGFLGGSVKNRSAIVVTSDMVNAGSARDVLVNLTDAVPPKFSEFARLIEIVSTDDLDRREARSRWKHYTELGYSIRRHDLASRGVSE